MKKKTLFFSLISTLTLSNLCGLPPSAFAEENIDGTAYWSFSEIAALNSEFDAEMESACAGNYSCVEDKLYAYSGQDSKYEALMRFRYSGLKVTAVNPAQETIKLYYSGRDYMSSSMFGREVRHNIKDIYLVWVEDGIGDPMSNGGWLIQGYRYPYHLAGAAAATHVILDESSTELGDGWFTSGVEREYSTASSDLSQNTTGKIYFSMIEDSGSMSNGTIPYDTCINSSEYQPGMECRLYFGEDGSTKYLPFSVTGLATDSSEGELNVIANMEPNTVMANQGSIKEKGTSHPETPSNELATTNAGKQSIHAPDTGEVTASQNYSTEFPWWLSIIFVAGLGALVWLFWPKLRKSPKNRKKTVDNTRGI